MKFCLNTLAAAAVALTAAAPGFAQAKLTDEQEQLLDEVVREIGDSEETAVAVYDYLDSKVFPPPAGLVADPTMVRLWLYRHASLDAKDNSNAKKGKNTDREPSDPDKETPLTEADKLRFPKLDNGDLDPAWIMLQLEPGSTKWWSYTSTGKTRYIRN
jgi:hypothetical protein